MDNDAHLHEVDERYYLLQVAREQFGCEPAKLDAEQLQQAGRIVARQRRIENAVLRSAEASGVVIPAAQVEEARAQIASRYADEQALQQALASHGLDDGGLRTGLARALKVEAVLERICAGLPAISDADLSLYYFNHPEQFQRPESREARHILITINADYPENTPEAARARLEAIAKRVRSKPERFADQALKHSECPTALQGGLLGYVTPGKLYPQLEASLFSLAVGELSPLLESPLGLHLLRCEAVVPAATVTLEEALPRLRERLHERQRKVFQRQWLERLLQQPAPVEKAHG
ncbi:MAG: nitrogen fixation protein NifM [Pseudomonas sagittaria]|nr:nitrogen fixation protein NifM [Pseudomonas sagittaria]